ncbi:MAG: hypothetical protein KIS76_09590 [Pyrinomonadaceae bacterium]|nr:hypothetical protein [Pyrinomonadaceae bacterium]
MLNSLNQRIFKHRKAVLMLYLLYALTGLSCGKRMPPLPPVDRVPQRAQIGAVQRGDSVFITWDMPARNASDSSVLNVDRVDIYRYAEPLSETRALTEGDFAAKSTVIASLKLSQADFGLKSKTYTDKLQFAGQAVRLIYAVRFVNSSGQKAAFSNFLLVEPASNVALAPSDVKVNLTESAVILKWDAPTANVDQTSPPNIIGYNIYRKSKAEEKPAKINARPVEGEQYSDETFGFDTTYEYFIRTVSLAADGETVESAETESVVIEPKDIFAPSAPGSITIAAAPNVMSIFFATNPESDIAGYQIFRSTDRDIPLQNWTKMTPELLKTNTFQDKTVRSGTRYYYYILAVDKNGNISAPSEIIVEKAP